MMMDMGGQELKTMDSTDELTRLAEAEQQLKEQHAARKKELAALYKKERGVIQKKVRIARNSISAADRKLRTRRLILMGSYMEHITANDPAAKDRLVKGLDGFLERDRNRALFDLPPKPDSGPETPHDGS